MVDLSLAFTVRTTRSDRGHFHPDPTAQNQTHGHGAAQASVAEEPEYQ